MKSAWWIHRSHLLRADEYTCSACGKTFERPYRECPACGVRMRKGRNDLSWIDEAEELSAFMDDDW